MEYTDFISHIGPDGYVRAFSEQGEASDKTVVEIPSEIQNYLNNIEKNETNARELKDFGMRLYDIVFPTNIDYLFRQTEAVAKERKQKIRIRLTIEPDSLASLPWEFVYREERGYFLSQEPSTVLSHYLDPPLPQRIAKKPDSFLNMLVIIANPSDQPFLDTQKWEKIITNSLHSLTEAGKIRIRIVTKATRREISKALLKMQPDLVQFVGHGIYQNGKGYLAMVEERTDKTFKVDEDWLSNMFIGANDHLKLICLASCESDRSNSPKGFVGIAPKIVQKGVPAVLAMRYSVLISTAEIFLEEFYKAIAEHKPIDWAVQWARNQVSLDKGLNNREFATPVLFMRAKDGNIFSDNSYKKLPSIQFKNERDDLQNKKERFANNPIRMLHLSDLHITTRANSESMLQPLFDDLKDKEEGLEINELDYLIITGDLTDKAKQEEFKKAVCFVEELKKCFNIQDDHCIIVPGNHDLSWDEYVYEWKRERDVEIGKLEKEKTKFKKEGDGYLIRKDNYPLRFKNFSDYLYLPLTHKEYPLDPENQCIPFLFAEHGILFMAMNSAWEIDENFQEDSGIHDGALSKGLMQAEKMIKEAKEAGALTEGDSLLKIAVWHHPVSGNEKIQNDAFMERLRKADFKLCFHGHVHEGRNDLIGYLHPTRKIHICGSGSFDAPSTNRPESTPCLYNLFEIFSDRKRVRVHTRCRERYGGAWEGWAKWPSPDDRHSKKTYYDIDLSTR